MVGFRVVCVDLERFSCIVDAFVEEIEIEVDHGSVAVRLCVGIVPLQSQRVLIFRLLELASDVELVSFDSLDIRSFFLLALQVEHVLQESCCLSHSFCF